MAFVEMEPWDDGTVVKLSQEQKQLFIQECIQKLKEHPEVNTWDISCGDTMIQVVHDDTYFNVYEMLIVASSKYAIEE